MAHLGSRFVALSLVASLTLGSLPALAGKDDEKITVVLKNGAKYRGVLVEEVPNDHVTIELATGEVKRFEWAEIEHEEPKPALPVQLPAPAPAAAPAGPSGPTVHISSATPGVVLERRIGQSQIAGGGLRVEHFEFVCRAPCDQGVTPGEYRLRGDGLRETPTFSLSGSESVRIQASLGSRGQWWAGTYLTAAGAGLLAVGILGVLVDPKTEDCTYGGYPNYETHCEPDHTLTNYSYAMAGIGLLSLGIGIALFANSTNSVQVDGASVAHVRVGNSTFAFGPRGLMF